MTISATLPREKEKVEGLMLGIFFAFAIMALTFIIFG